MFLKRDSFVNEMSNVRYINGYVSIGKVKLNACCFEIDGVLIDTGAQTLLKEFKTFFAGLDVDQVVITHLHEDHTGGASYLQKQYHLPIYMNKITIKKGAKRADYPLYRQLFWGRRGAFCAKPIGKTFSSRNVTWDVIETPGHTRDHLSFLNRQTGQLFAGDLFVHPKTKVVSRDEHIPSIIHSIEKVLTYDFAELFCCHAGYVKDGRQALTMKLHYLQELEDKVHTLQKQGYSEKEITELLFTRKYPITFLSFGEWDSIHIIKSILS